MSDRLRWTGIRYRDPETGRYITRAAVRKALEDSLTNIERLTESLANDLRAGRISLDGWRSEMRDVVKQVHIAARALAVGGRAQMTKADFGAVGSEVRRQYRYLEAWTEQIKGGRSLNELESRSAQYLRSARTSFFKHEADVNEAAGFDEIRSILHEAEHCAECVAEAARGFVPIASHVPIGERTCRHNDRCTSEYRNRATGQTFGQAGLSGSPTIRRAAESPLPTGVQVGSADGLEADTGPVRPPPTLSPAAEAALVAFEDANRSSPIEFARVVNERGEVLVEAQGRKDYVEFADNQLRHLRGNIMTHNHPGGASISVPDIELMKTYAMKEMRAVGQYGGVKITYRIAFTPATKTPGTEVFTTSFLRKDIARLLSKNFQHFKQYAKGDVPLPSDLQRLYDAEVAAGRLPEDARTLVVAREQYHMAVQDLAREYGFLYERRIEGGL